jgi:pyridoxine 5-phosphate synthase
MVNLSVNVNKIATLRNSRGNNVPNLLSAVDSIIRFGAQGITVHPRPDQRHITTNDVLDLSKTIGQRVEFNIEGYPSDAFIQLVLSAKPAQVTLVPDNPGVLTSLEGWDTTQDTQILSDAIKTFQSHSIRTAIFIHPDSRMVEGASKLNADRIELFTGLYAQSILEDTIIQYIESSQLANKLDMGVNAGHDLNLKNLSYFYNKMPFLDEVSIGHALISESLFLGLENTINMYKRILQ